MELGMLTRFGVYILSLQLVLYIFQLTASSIFQ